MPNSVVIGSPLCNVKATGCKPDETACIYGAAEGGRGRRVVHLGRQLPRGRRRHPASGLPRRGFFAHVLYTDRIRGRGLALLPVERLQGGARVRRRWELLRLVHWNLQTLLLRSLDMHGTSERRRSRQRRNVLRPRARLRRKFVEQDGAARARVRCRPCVRSAHGQLRLRSELHRREPLDRANGLRDPWNRHRRRPLYA